VAVVVLLDKAHQVVPLVVLAEVLLVEALEVHQGEMAHLLQQVLKAQQVEALVEEVHLQHFQE
jgi:hypothetical protein